MLCSCLLQGKCKHLASPLVYHCKSRPAKRRASGSPVLVSQTAWAACCSPGTASCLLMTIAYSPVYQAGRVPHQRPPSSHARTGWTARCTSGRCTHTRPGRTARPRTPARPRLAPGSSSQSPRPPGTPANTCGWFTLHALSPLFLTSFLPAICKQPNFLLMTGRRRW